MKKVICLIFILTIFMSNVVFAKSLTDVPPENFKAKSIKVTESEQTNHKQTKEEFAQKYYEITGEPYTGYVAGSEESESSGGGEWSLGGLAQSIAEIPSKLIEPIKEAITGVIQEKTAEMYSDIIDNHVKGLLDIIPNLLKDTPELWSKTKSTAVNVITDALIPICITLATIGFIINLGRGLAGDVSFGRSTWRSFLRLIVTIILIGSSGRLMQWIIDFNDAFIVFINDKMSVDITQTFKNAIIDQNLLYGATATFNSVMLIGMTGWILWIAALSVQFMLVLRLIQLMFYMLLGPLVFTCNIVEETTDIVSSYMRKFVAVVLKSFFYNLIFITYINAITLPNAMPVGIISGPLVLIVLIISLFMIPKEFEELLGVGRTAHFNVGSLIQAIGGIIAAL